MDTRKNITQVDLPEEQARINLKVGADLERRLAAEALRLRVSKSEIIRRACEMYLGMPLGIRGNGYDA